MPLSTDCVRRYAKYHTQRQNVQHLLYVCMHVSMYVIHSYMRCLARVSSELADKRGQRQPAICGTSLGTRVGAAFPQFARWRRARLRAGSGMASPEALQSRAESLALSLQRRTQSLLANERSSRAARIGEQHLVEDFLARRISKAQYSSLVRLAAEEVLTWPAAFGGPPQQGEPSASDAVFRQKVMSFLDAKKELLLDRRSPDGPMTTLVWPHVERVAHGAAHASAKPQPALDAASVRPAP